MLLLTNEISSLICPNAGHELLRHVLFAAGGRAHGPSGAHRGPVAACEEGPRPSIGPPVFGEPLSEGCAAAR